MRTLSLKSHKNRASENSAPERKVKEYLDFSFRDFMWPLAFLLSATMVGLNFPLGYLFIILILVNRWAKDKYDFIIQFTLFSGGYALIIPYHDLFIPYDKILLLLSIFFMIVYKKNLIEKKICIALLVYTVFLFFFAFLSEEKIKIQFTGIVNYISLFFFIFPLVAFGKHKFDMMVFLRRLFPYLFILCIYYILDGFILCGNLFIPRDTFATYSGHFATFYNLYVYPFSFNFIRIWPLGLFISVPCVYALSRYFKMRVWQWVIFILALVVCRTFTFYVALLIVWVVSQESAKRKLRIALYAVLTLVVGYLIDSEPVTIEDSGRQSTLRIRSSVEQFSLLNAKDVDDLALFGSNRMIVAIPALDLLYNLNREWIGLGFLSQDRTTNSKYIFVSDFTFEDDPNDKRREMVATGIEIAPIQIVLTIGYLGLIVHCLFFIALWMFVRKLKYSNFFGSVIIGFIVLGLGGFSGIIFYTGLYICGLSLATVLLANPQEENSDKKRKRKRMLPQS